MIEPPALDDPAIVAEVSAAFAAYEAALSANDVDDLDRWFWNDARLVRFGIAEVQHGAAEVAAWRRTGPGVPAERAHRRVTITALGPDVAVVGLEFVNGDPADAALPVGRQSQVWARLPDGWRVVHAHVSMIDPPTAA
jgi:ketosteroid isomerase-like protein